MDWLAQSFQWYIFLLILGLSFFPFATLVFGRFFPDRGYPFAKTIAILFVSYTVLVSATAKILPFSSTSLTLILAGWLTVSLLVAKSTLRRSDFSRRTLILIVAEEALFLLGFLAWTYVRGQEPSIRGLEKFMDFGFMQSILRADYFPPLDMWLSATRETPQGFAINYYYFGHLTGAVLIRLTNIVPSVGYNLILSTIFALSVTQVFSLFIAIFSHASQSLATGLKKHIRLWKIGVLALIGTYLINLGGNLHTIYLFTKGYEPDHPVPFWEILSSYNPLNYWYPNATRFIPFTIHEFPSYSYVVADLHGHVFDIPFVLTTVAILLTMTLAIKAKAHAFRPYLPYVLMIGFLTAVHYMTNAFDGPIYLLLAVLLIFGLTADIKKTALSAVLMGMVFFVTTLPFSLHFKPFVSGIGVNCSPAFLLSLGKLGPFIFEKGNCQVSALWMLFILWGFFLISFGIYMFILSRSSLRTKKTPVLTRLNLFVLILFAYGVFLITVPEFFYLKDIYPAHFRANTMFKLGYQAYILMGVAALYAFFLTPHLSKMSSLVARGIFVVAMVFVAIYPFYSVPSYYGNLKRPVVLDGSAWITASFPQDKEIIDFLNANVAGQPVILEAQGDSYTDYERISSYTGLPTVAGWWVHEWLWRGSPSVVGDRIPDIGEIYTSSDLAKTRELLHKYTVRYVIVSESERTKYEGLNEGKFSQIGTLVFRSKNGLGSVYQVNITNP